MEALPAVGVPAEQVLAEIAELRAADLPTHGGRLFAYVYDPAVPGLDELTAAAHALSAHVNGLNPTAFPSLLAMENALVGAAAALLGGGPAGVARSSATSPAAAPSRSSSRSRRPATPGPTSPSPSWSCPYGPRRAGQGGVLPAASGWSPCRVDPVTLRPVAGGHRGGHHPGHRAGGLLGPVVRPRAHRPGRGASPRRPPAGACAATWTPASAAGRCPTCAGSGRRCRRSTSRCPA